ncbi:sigma 54-interacting transcriptional regulator [Erwinia sp. BNK-24-b]|uniref:sigma 54-interacting transcriptional regulator n=1 Tax=Erwinia TaxID=551 RepID=UPI001FEF8025|nr:sigma 54-interacting transcriptional regulator [Erwinia phyllosphaerae]MBV4368612.1 sigma 54-interacting transcriptional regulator [Erwinia phyllosphaerae]
MVTGSEKQPGSFHHDKVTAFLTETGLSETIRTDIHASLHPMIDNLAPLKVDLLLEGETGTGKDTLARRIYQLSGAKGPLIAVNCAAIPENLAESELFGVIAGAYTGASHSRAGYIEASDKGILFLDEIDSMPLILQAKLLRVLETRAIHRLGSTSPVPLDLRIIAASQTPLAELVAAGSFRRDLYFRLSTIKIETPTVRSHAELIIPLFRRFTQEAAMRLKQAIPPRSLALDEALLLHSWPGNIRELKAAAERHVLHLPPLCDITPADGEATLLKDRLRRIERSLIKECLHRHGHKIDDVVHELGIPRRTLYHRIKLLNIVA